MEESEIFDSQSTKPIELIQQPPFFRTRDFSTPLYPSNCYAVPKQSCMVDDPVVEVFDEIANRFIIPKRSEKLIKFVGVDAVSYEDAEPATHLQPLPREVSDCIESNNRFAIKFLQRLNESRS